MEHPFFGQLRYPWHRQEADLFHEMLVEVVQNPAQIDLFYKKCADRLPPLALGAPLLMWKEALENLATHGALRKLCDLAIAQYKQNDRVQNVIRAVVDAKPAIDVTIISHDVLVLDRVNLREQLALLEPDATPLKVLLVRGEPGSGKSHGRYLFERAALDRDAQAIYVNQDIVVTVDDVVRQLFSALEASEKISPRETHRRTLGIDWCASSCKSWPRSNIGLYGLQSTISDLRRMVLLSSTRTFESSLSNLRLIW